MRVVLLSQLVAITVAGAAVAVADAFIKRLLLPTSIRMTATLTIGIIVLYALQIGGFFFVFSRQMRLGVAGNLQMVAYSIATVLLGAYWFHERLAWPQIVGVTLALFGCILMLTDW